MRKREWVAGLLGGLVLVLVAAAGAGDRFEVVEVEGDLQRATGPVELLDIASEDRATVRALRAFARLPDEFGALALALRSTGVDLLAAGAPEIAELVDAAEGGRLNADPQALRRLQELLDGHEYLDWEPLQVGATIDSDARGLLRGEGRAVLRSAEGQDLALELRGGQEDLPSALAVLAAAAQARDDAAEGEAAAALPVPPALWSGSPGMRVYAPPSDGPYSYEARWQDLAQVVATADGGYLAAGTVAYELRLAKFDRDGRVEWTRLHAAPFDLYAHALAASPDGGYRIAGDRGRGHPAFLLALDAEGQMRWAEASRLEWGGPEDDHERLLALAVNSTGESLAAGWRLEQGEPQALAVLFDSGGGLRWRQALPGAAQIRSVVALDDGWFVAGEAADPPRAAWFARLTAAGEVAWELAIEEPDSGAANAAALLPDGRLAVAGQRDDTFEFWLMRLTPDGDFVDARRLEILDGGSPVVHELLGLSVDADGSYLVGGVTPDADGWIARLDPAQGVLWHRIYGGGDQDALKAVIPHADGLVAAGLSASADPDAGYALWLVAADRDGMPLAAGERSEPVLALNELLHSLQWAPDSPLLLGGEPEIHEHADGSLRVVLPFLSAYLPLSPDPWADGVELDLGTIVADLQPLGAERWRVAVELPAAIGFLGDYGELLARMTFAERSLEGIWAGDLLSFLQLDLRLGDIVLDLEPVSPLAALDRFSGHDDASGNAWGPDPNRPARMAVGGVVLTLDLEETDPGVVNGPLEFALDGIVLESAAGDSHGKLGRLVLGADYHGVDLAGVAAIGDLAANPEAMTERDPGELLAEVLTALGGFESRMELSDLSIQAPPGEEGHLHVARIAVDTGFLPSVEGDLKRDLRGSAEGEGFSYRDESFAFEFDSFGWNLRLDRVAPMTLLHLGLASLMTGELAEEEVLASAQRILGGFGFGLSLSGARGRMVAEYADDEPPFGLDHFEFGLALSDLDTAAPGASLAYRHRGVAGIPMGVSPIPEEFFPRELVVDLVASRLPAGFFAEQASLPGLTGATPELAQGAFLAALENATRIDINEFVIDLPIGGVSLKGHARAENEDAAEPGALESEFELEIRNLDTLVDLAMELSDSDEGRQQIRATATMLKLLGEERRSADGEPLHYFHVHASSTGGLMVNGNDLAPLLGGGGN